MLKTVKVRRDETLSRSDSTAIRRVLEEETPFEEVTLVVHCGHGESLHAVFVEVVEMAVDVDVDIRLGPVR